MENENKYLSVSALNKYLYYKFDTDLNLRNVYLKGEVSNARLSKGILYFVLKDSESEISALMFSSILDKLNFKIEDGMQVLVSGKVGVYHKKGNYAITVNSIEASGIGEAYLNFIKLKEKLANEGLFDDKYKKPFNEYNHKIGLVTSSTGDAMHDVISTVAKRYPLSEVILYPALVQGSDAPRSLINAINKANEESIVDVLIIARGGGTIEDLSCFNDEELARTIFDCNIPTISGVGHEADFTICDFVSDRRAPTPTGAAVIATPDMNDLVRDINNKQSILVNFIKNKLTTCCNDYINLKNNYAFSRFDEYLNKYEDKINNLQTRLKSLSPIERIDNNLKTLDNIKINIEKGYKSYLDNIDHKLKNNIDKLIILNPLNLMSKGYSLTYQDDKLITNINEVNKDKEIKTVVNGGSVTSKVLEIIEDNKNE